MTTLEFQSLLILLFYNINIIFWRNCWHQFPNYSRYLDYDSTKSEYQCVLLREGFKKKEKKLEFSNFVGDPPSPPKVGKYPIFFFTWPVGQIFFIKFFAYSCHETYNIKKSKFSKKILYCVGAGTPRSLATQPTLEGGRAVSLK